MDKLETPLYHGTSRAAAILICGGHGFNAPLYLTENREAAIHYAKAATAYLEAAVRERGGKLMAEGYALFTFRNVPNRNYLSLDTYSSMEPGQWKYLKQLSGLRHFTFESYPLAVSQEEHLRLQCFAIGMWRR